MQEYVINRPDEEAMEQILQKNFDNAAGAVLRLAWQAGLLRDEIQRLSWAQIDFLDGCIVLPDRRVPIPEDLSAWLSALREGRNRCSEVVVLSDRDKKPLTPQSISRLARQALDALVATFNSNLQQTVCTVEGQKPENTENVTGMWLKITPGVPGYGLDADTLSAQLRDAYNRNTFHTEVPCTVIEPEKPDLEALFAAHCTAPVDAVMDPKTFEITDGTDGYGFDIEQAAQALAEATPGDTLTFPFQPLTPEVTAETLAATLYCDVLGTCKTPYSGSDNNNRNTNLRLACEAINGKIILPGEIFTYNHTLGERTAAAGYKPAASYASNGRTVDTYGGGICQVSTNLYYCTLLADLEIVERWHHGYVPAYITWGMDASVSWNSGDFRFKNNTNYPIRIEAHRSGGYVYVQLLGTDEKDYYVKMESETLSTKKYETVYEEHAPDNKYGYKDGQELVSPYTGYKVNAYKCKYDKATDALISRELESVNNYSKRDRLLVKIVDPAKEAEPPAVG